MFIYIYKGIFMQKEKNGMTVDSFIIIAVVDYIIFIDYCLYC